MNFSMKKSFNGDATKCSHIIGLCLYFSSGCYEPKLSIVEGAHPQLQAIQLTKDKISGAVVMNHKQTLEDLHFSGKSILKGISSQSWPWSEQLINDRCLLVKKN
jgi:hypothetical protein